MQSTGTVARIEQWLSNPQRVLAYVVVLVVLAAWGYWTYWSQASWFHQILFVALLLTGLMLLIKPTWFLNFIVLVLVADVSGYARDAIQIPGLIGLAGMGGKLKIPELLSLLAVFHMAIYFLMRPQEFRQPLMGRVALFCLAGLLATAIGVQRYVATSTMRDSLAYYFSLFYIIGLVLLPNARSARTTFKVFFYATLFVLAYGYAAYAVTRSSEMFYSATREMFFSVCAYVLIAKLFSSPPGTRRWLTAIMILLLSAAMFIGRTRGGVIAFLGGLLPLFLVLRPRQQLAITGAVLVPCLALMLLLFFVEARRQTTSSDDFHKDPGARGIEAFTQMGDPDADPTGSYRLHMWREAWRGFLSSPIYGKGYGWQLPVWTAWSHTDEDMPAAIIHNSYLHVLACSGLLGFAPLVAFVVGFFQLCWRQFRRSATPTKRLFTAVATGIGINFFLTAVTNVAFEIASIGLMGWLLIALAVRLAQASDEDLATLIPRRFAGS